MTTLTIIILTILAYELINLIVYVASNENDALLIRVSMGAWWLIANIITLISRVILKMYYSKKYCIYQFFGKVSESKMESQSDKWIHNYYMTKKVASQFKQVGKGEFITEDYSIRLLRDGKELKSIPMKYDILTQEKINKGVPGMSADFIEKFKK